MTRPTLVAALLALGGIVAADEVTFNRDIAPIVFENCSVCHRPGEAGPFSLLSYRDVRAHAKEIGEVTARRYMPPWLPEPGEHVFEGARRLTDKQIALIRRWLETGAAEGDPGDRPASPRFTEGWQLGPPDLVLTPPQPYLLR
ncbi:MAG TPA: cytochrome c, partial [Vicinamibacteria bacterium]|nr:cytochrome c [Vicinamibacteria bacterium]